MNSGKVISAAILGIALIAGATLFYQQIYAFYEEVPASGEGDVVLTKISGGPPESIPYDNFKAIDAESSPIRYRACFTTALSPEALAGTYESYESIPRVAPGWFDCFDAEAIGAEIAAGTARVFLSQKNIAYGVDRVVAITDDGRGYVWHDLNDCGDKAYDGTVVGEECPPREDFN